MKKVAAELLKPVMAWLLTFYLLCRRIIGRCESTRVHTGQPLACVRVYVCAGVSVGVRVGVRV